MNKEEIESCLNARLALKLEDNCTVALAIYYLAKVFEENKEDDKYR